MPVCASIFFFFFFQEAEEEMKELEEYKDAKSLLDSVELEHWFPDESLSSLWDSAASTLHSLCRAQFNYRHTESIPNPSPPPQPQPQPCTLGFIIFNVDFITTAVFDH